jgi:hypothetical protein
LRDDGTIYFLDQGLFKNGEYAVQVNDGQRKWREPRYGFWMEIQCPYEEFEENDKYGLVLEPGGRLYQVRKDRLERMLMKSESGQWYRTDPVTGEWLEVDWGY